MSDIALADLSTDIPRSSQKKRLKAVCQRFHHFHGNGLQNLSIDTQIVVSCHMLTLYFRLCHKDTLQAVVPCLWRFQLKNDKIILESSRD